MKETQSLKQNKDFKRLYYRGASVVTEFAVVYSMRNRLTQNRLGITVGKKIGCAVKRNRVRRIIKESYRLLEPRISKGYDFVIVGRGRAAGVKTADISRAIEKALAVKNLIS
ncbi:MAG: ribonuclease P protein component [Clostridia bacterium]|nr:ribonuclease P protein component [Clostridia bacterium]